MILNATLMEDDPSMEVLAFGDVQTIAPSHGAPDCMLTAGVANMSVSQVTRAATPWLSVLVTSPQFPLRAESDLRRGNRAVIEEWQCK